jgi:fructokinase
LLIGEQIYDKVDNSSIFFTGSFILSKNPARSTAIKIIEYAVKKNKFFAFDPSFRASLWPEGNKGSEIIRELISQADVIKPSLDDAYHLYGQDHPENYLKKYHSDGAKIVVLSLGKDGVLLSDSSSEPLHIPVFSEKVVDVTGAGDSFWSGFLTGILKGLPIKEAARLGNAVAAFKIQGVGALSSVPPLMEIMSYYDIQPIEGGKLNERN